MDLRSASCPQRFVGQEISDIGQMRQVPVSVRGGVEEGSPNTCKRSSGEGGHEQRRSTKPAPQGSEAHYLQVVEIAFGCLLQQVQNIRWGTRQQKVLDQSVYPLPYDVNCFMLAISC